jgi:hypothetical protein
MTTMTATTMTMETKATVAAAAWQEHGVGGGGSAAAALAAAVWWQQRGGGGSGGRSAFKGSVRGRIGRVGRGGSWQSSLSWDVEFLVEFREPSMWGDMPRGGRAKAKTKAKAMLTATADRMVMRGRKETT